MTRTNDPVMQLFNAIAGGTLTPKQRTILALLVHAIATQDPHEEDMQAAMWRFVRRDFAKLLDAYPHPSEHDQTRED